MKRGGNNTILFIGVMMFAGGCNSLTPGRDQPHTLQADTITIADSTPGYPVKPGTGDTIALKENSTAQPDLLLTDERPSPSARMLSEADKTYIDWIIPDYPDVILLHEGSAETLNYTEAVYRYLKLKNGSVQKKIITQKYASKARDKRLHIADVGENWYEVYVFDEWK